MSDKKTSLYINDLMRERLDPYIKRHEGLSGAVTIIADRYAELVAREKRELRKLFTVQEKLLMLNNAMSTGYEPAAVIPGAVLADTEDEEAIQFEEFGVDREALLGKLTGLNLGQQFALVDWLEEEREQVGK